MNVVYFTNGETLFDHELRRQCLRIPEVLQSINQSPLKEQIDWPSSLLLDDEFRKLEAPVQQRVIQYIQQGLFDRFCQSNVPYADILRRPPKGTAQEVIQTLQAFISAQSSLCVYVIGPGLDEVSIRLKSPKLRWIDVIENDPLLSWFWPPLAKTSAS